MNRYVVSLIALPVFWFFAVFGVDAALEGGTRPDHPANRLECGIHLTDLPDDALPLVESVRVVLITDEEWRDTIRGAQPSGARHVLLDAASLFRGVSIHFLPVRIVDWDSPDGIDTIRDVWAVARESIPIGDADVAMVLTAQARSTSQDGYAERSGRYVAVAHHPEHHGRDALVLAHEVSHLFGADHGCDVPGRAGLMTSRGFDRDLICPCTRRILELNANRFHAANDEHPN